MRQTWEHASEIHVIVQESLHLLKHILLYFYIASLLRSPLPEDGLALPSQTSSLPFQAAYGNGCTVISGIKFVFNSTPDCEVVHGALYSCLRAIFGLSVIGILVCIFSCMLVYQLLRYVRKINRILLGRNSDYTLSFIFSSQKRFLSKQKIVKSLTFEGVFRFGGCRTFFFNPKFEKSSFEFCQTLPTFTLSQIKK